MTDSDDATLEAKVTRYDIARLRCGQLLLPIAVVTAVAARRFPNVFTVLLAVGAQAATLALLLSAGRRFGWQWVVLEHGGLSIGSTDARIERHVIHRWTVVNGVARLYGLERSYKIQARSGAEVELPAFLSRCFGPPLTLRRRGSFRGRLIALTPSMRSRRESIPYPGRLSARPSLRHVISGRGNPLSCRHDRCPRHRSSSWFTDGFFREVQALFQLHWPTSIHDKLCGCGL